MRLAHLKITNVLGIEQFELKAGQITKLIGTNETGKTSVLEAIKAALGGGTDATLRRDGEDGEIVLVLDDGTRIRKAITKNQRLTVQKPGENGKVRGQPNLGQSYLDSIVNLNSLNPVAFIAADHKERVGMLQRSARLDLDVGRLKAIMEPVAGQEIHYLDEWTKTRGDPFILIETIRKATYDQRTAENRSVRDSAATANSLQAQLPNGTREKAQQEWLEAEREYTLLSNKRAEERQKIESSRDVKLADIRERLEAGIAELRRQADEATQATVEETDSLLKSVAETYDTKIEDAAAEKARRGELVKQHDRAQETARIIENHRTLATDAHERSRACTRALQELDDYKVSLMNQLPVEGMEIRDDGIYIDGVPFNRVNEGRQIATAIEIAKASASELGLILVDGIERFDKTNQKLFEQYARDSGLQFIVTKVDQEAEAPNKLRVES